MTRLQWVDLKLSELPETWFMALQFGLFTIPLNRRSNEGIDEVDLAFNIYVN